MAAGSGLDDPLSGLCLDEGDALPPAGPPAASPPAAQASSYDLRISPTKTVLQLAALIQERFGAMASEHNLLYCGQQLKSTSTLKEAGVVNGAHIFMTPRVHLRRQMSNELRQQFVEGQLNRDAELESFESKTYSTMLQWLKDSDAGCTDVQRIDDADSYDLGGLVLNKDVPEGETVMSIPMHCIITDSIAKQSAIGKLIEESGCNVSSNQSIVASFLLQEKRDESSYARKFTPLACCPCPNPHERHKQQNEEKEKKATNFPAGIGSLTSTCCVFPPSTTRCLSSTKKIFSTIYRVRASCRRFPNA